ncbi:OmpH family outer membrane protein [Selenomonas ruminantium]|jgi:Skp family chaperone for outer membrane proteins|uniref:Outer membrane protein (OmpH-like) n=1 Tax=Selenomonas ruminantium TaxID=971 RepID=A0A1K1MZZ5_SELRU|nr:OmpH family outer membrane protein [Selenomonas ruminantium]SEA03167.1 Outer membrane protein (OmpH-like) [Selenomonas ruminantium]SFA98434.1 periplasmic chaperone for outer membrane proteins Skp [Selenomonas ruminantium]SFW28601.1 Outer membrane protein (OmpH-like) [Selenomonas ruminantium]
MKLRKKTAAAMIMALLCATLASGCGQTKIGYIDGERVSKEAPQINSLIEEGNQKIEEAQTQASQDLQKKMQENPNMSQEDLQKAQMDGQRKIQGLNQSYSLQLRQKMDVALAAVSKNKKLDAVVNNSTDQPVAVTGAVDVTDDVIAQLQ